MAALPSDQCLADVAAIVEYSLQFLRESAVQVRLMSAVRDKSYSAFHKPDSTSLTRPANDQLFDVNLFDIDGMLKSWYSGRLIGEEARRLLYTVALAPCLVLELYDRGNKKGPATYFERVIGHLFSRALNTVPTTEAKFDLGPDLHARMTMDFLFEPKGRNKIHLAAKMSTRERIVQAWAHQAMLDKAFGEYAYTGMLVSFSETKLALQTREVTEICVPDQWLAYQTSLATMDRIFYFDVPRRYQEMADRHPTLFNLRSFPTTPAEIVSALAPA